MTEESAKDQTFKPTVYLKKNPEVTINAYYDETNKCFIDNATQQTYLFNQFFKGTDGEALANGDVATVTLALDLANTVIYYTAA